MALHKAYFLEVLGLKWPLAATMIWQPFDTRFAVILKRFKEHRDLIELEVNASSHAHLVKVAHQVDAMLKDVQSQSTIQDETIRKQNRIAIGKRSSLVSSDLVIIDCHRHETGKPQGLDQPADMAERV